MKRKSGFTLAEVLITLAIIGVVASMTLPSLNTNIGAARNRAALKKALSTLNGAVRMNEANNGWNFSALTANITNCHESNIENSRNESAESSLTMCGLLNDSLVGETIIGDRSDLDDNNNVNIAQIRGTSGASPNHYVHYRLADGAVIALSNFSSNCTEDNIFDNGCFGYIDVNGAQGPNQVITCNDDNSSVGFIWDEDFESCEVQRNSNADQFPVVLYDSTVELSSNAAVAYFNAR